MKNFFDRILLSILLGLAVLLGLCFLLNTMFGFNLFSSEHWAEISRLQAEQIPINNGFYISIVVAIFIFVFGLCIIYAPLYKRVHVVKPVGVKPDVVQNNYPKITKEPESEPERNVLPTTESRPMGIQTSRPPRLNLPSNMAQIAKARHENMNMQPAQQDLSKQYDAEISQIFSDAGFVVKPNITVSGFTSNLFAIAPNEIMWIGAVDKDVNKLQSAVDRLNSIFRETLEDIRININAFVIDTKNQQTAPDSVFVFKSLDELKKFVSEMPPVWPKEIANYEQENFDAYSEYIDTIIQYVKNIG